MEGISKLSHILRSELTMCLKQKVFNQCILPTMTYTLETWTLTKHMKTRMEIKGKVMERSMLGITRRDWWENMFIRSKTRVEDIIMYTKKPNGAGLDTWQEQMTDFQKDVLNGCLEWKKDHKED